MFDEGMGAQPGVLDALEHPASVAHASSITQPGPQSLALMSVVEPDRLSPAEKIDLLVAYERHAAWVAACQARVLASVARDEPRGDDDWVRDQVAAALKLSGFGRGSAHRSGRGSRHPTEWHLGPAGRGEDQLSARIGDPRRDLGP